MAQPDEPPEGTAGGLLTQKAYAKRRGWSKQYVHQLVKRGRIPLREGRIDPAAADAALARDRDPARHPANPMAAPEGDGPLPPDAASQVAFKAFSKARSVREHYRALKERLEFMQQARELVCARTVETEVRAAATEFRDSLHRAAIELGKMLAGKYGLDSREVVELTTEEVRKTLEELSDRFMERAMAYKRREAAEVDE